MPSATKVANGNIIPSRFVKLDTTANGKVLQAGAGEDCYGISHPGTRRLPGDLGLDDGYIAVAGENVPIYIGPEKDVLLELGGTVTVGDYIKSGTLGVGLTSSTDHDKICARAMKSGVNGDLIPVQIIKFELSR